jgi:hypothetical protein
MNALMEDLAAVLEFLMKNHADDETMNAFHRIRGRITIFVMKAWQTQMEETEIQ